MIALLLLLACSKPAPPADSGLAPADPCEPGPDPELVIGVGEAGYEPLIEGDPVELVHGPQGGYHVVLALAARSLDASDKWTLLMSGTVDGELWGQTAPYADPRCNAEEGRQEAWNLLLIWDEGITPEELDGRYAEIEVQVTDAAGTVITATSALTIDDRSR